MLIFSQKSVGKMNFLLVFLHDLFLVQQCRRYISPCYDFLPVVKDFCLLFSNPVGQIVFYFCAIIAVKRILEPEVASVVPKTNQNISSEIFVHIVLTNLKIAVQENAVLNFAQFVKVFNNLNSFVMFHTQIVFLMCFILWGSVKYYSFLNLTLQRWGNKIPCATFLCTGYKIKINYLVYRDIRLFRGIISGKC